MNHKNKVLLKATSIVITGIFLFNSIFIDLTWAGNDALRVLRLLEVDKGSTKRREAFDTAFTMRLLPDNYRGETSIVQDSILLTPARSSAANVISDLDERVARACIAFFRDKGLSGDFEGDAFNEACLAFWQERQDKKGELSEDELKKIGRRAIRRLLQREEKQREILRKIREGDITVLEERTVGQRLKSERIMMELSQKALGKITGIDKSHIGRYERGKVPLSLNMKKLAEGLRTTICYLLIGLSEEEFIDLPIEDSNNPVNQKISGLTLKLLRYKEGLTIKEVSELTGIHPTMISRFESGNRLPCFIHMERFTKIYGTMPKKLLTTSRSPKITSHRFKYLIDILRKYPEFGQKGFTVSEFIVFLEEQNLLLPKLFVTIRTKASLKDFIWHICLVIVQKGFLIRKYNLGFDRRSVKQGYIYFRPHDYESLFEVEKKKLGDIGDDYFTCLRTLATDARDGSDELRTSALHHSPLRGSGTGQATQTPTSPTLEVGQPAELSDMGTGPFLTKYQILGPVPIAGQAFARSSAIKLETENLMGALVTLIAEAKGDQEKLEQISFDLATLLLDGYSHLIWTSIGMEHLHHFIKPYKQILRICGEALVIASNENPALNLKRYFEPSFYDADDEFNDSQRDNNRLAGFYRNEEFALDFTKAFAEEPEGSQPWDIDSQIAILDVIDGIEFRSQEILDEVITKLKLQLEESEHQHSLIRNRLQDLISCLKMRGIAEDKTYNDRLIERFRQAKKKKSTRTPLFKLMRRIARSGLFVLKGGLEDWGPQPDVIDRAEGMEQDHDKYIAFLSALTKTRINYRSPTLSFGGSDAPRTSPTEEIVFPAPMPRVDLEHLGTAARGIQRHEA